jgi:GTPase SAR1 family protein
LEDVRFGVLMIGAPGVGKSTLVKALSEHMTEQGRAHCVVNLDAANENYDCGVDVRDLITLEDAMEDLKLGPNGGTLYCADFLCANFSWLEDRIVSYQLAHKDCQYFVFDLPGQVELYASDHQSLGQTLAKLQKDLQF